MTEPEHIRALRRRQERLEEGGCWEEASRTAQIITNELSRLASPVISVERGERHFPEPVTNYC